MKKIIEKKKKKSKLIREKEIIKRMERGNEYPKEYVFQRLEELKEKEKRGN